MFFIVETPRKFHSFSFEMLFTYLTDRTFSALSRILKLFLGQVLVIMNNYDFQMKHMPIFLLHVFK